MGHFEVTVLLSGRDTLTQRSSKQVCLTSDSMKSLVTLFGVSAVLCPVQNNT